MKKGMAWALCLCMAAGVLGGCANKYEEAAVIAETSAQPVTETSAEIVIIQETTAPEEESQPESGSKILDLTDRTGKDGKVRSYLTGEWVDETAGNRRPIATMMSNDKESLPQYGINRAGVVYEANVEGTMNRYMSIIEEYDDLERIGSTRSCRTYYTYFAKEFDAI